MMVNFLKLSNRNKSKAVFLKQNEWIQENFDEKVTYEYYTVESAVYDIRLEYNLSTLLKRWCNKSNNAVTLLHLNAKQSYQLLHRVKEARPTLRLQLTQQLTLKNKRAHLQISNNR